MATTSQQARIFLRMDARRMTSSASMSDAQIFQLNLHTILSAHVYGHVSEACALRAIAKMLRECFSVK